MLTPGLPPWTQVPLCEPGDEDFGLPGGADTTLSAPGAPLCALWGPVRRAGGNLPRVAEAEAEAGWLAGVLLARRGLRGSSGRLSPKTQQRRWVSTIPKPATLAAKCEERLGGAVPPALLYFTCRNSEPRPSPLARRRAWLGLTGGGRGM